MSQRKPIRVAHIMGKMNGGGVESVVMNYYRHIDRSCVQFDFIVDSDSTLVPYEEISYLGGRVFEIPPYWHQISYQRELKRLFSHNEWAIVHSHINALSVFPLYAAERAGIPIRIAHSHSTSGKGEHAKNIIKNVLRTQSNRYSTHRFACSKYAGEWLFGKDTPFSICRNAVDLSLFSFDPLERDRKRLELSIDSNTKVIGHIGRFAEQKNHKFLLQVFKCYLDIVPDAKLLLVGTGPLMEHVKADSVKLGISNNVIFLGQRNDVADLYQVFDVVCLPSLYEGLPVVGVECQISCTPILVSDAVTHEARFTSLMQFMSLDDSPKAWAERIAQLMFCRPTNGDKSAMHLWDIDRNASLLQQEYQKMITNLLDRVIYE